MHRIAFPSLCVLATFALGIAAATPAAAAPGDVTYTATTVGASVTSVFTNDTDVEIGCEFAGLNEPFDPAANYDEYPYAFVGGAVVLAGQSLTLGPSNFVEEPVFTVGQEIFVEWGCFTNIDDDEAEKEFWGTQLVEYIDDGIYDRTAETTVIVVGLSVTPGPPPVDVCTGSACLPTGSFGF